MKDLEITMADVLALLKARPDLQVLVENIALKRVVEELSSKQNGHKSEKKVEATA
jgi:hypothetical protein